MATIITFTKPMSEFQSFIDNGAEVAKHINLDGCTDFWAKGTNSELLIYNGRQIVYSCCYTEAYRKLFITSVWSKNGCEYEQDIDYDALEKRFAKRAKQ